MVTELAAGEQAGKIKCSESAQLRCTFWRKFFPQPNLNELTREAYRRNTSEWEDRDKCKAEAAVQTVTLYGPAEWERSDDNEKGFWLENNKRGPPERAT